MKNVNCLLCKCEFKIENYRKTKYGFFCSSHCQKQWLSSDQNPNYKRITVKCLYCNQSFIKLRSSSKRFCNSQCYGKFNSENPNVIQKRKDPLKKTVKCIYCCKSFKIWNYRYKKNQNYYCSKQCMDEIRRDEIICLTCGVEFIAPKYEKRKYCSSECSNKKIYTNSIPEKEIKNYLLTNGIILDEKFIITHDCGFFKPDIISVKYKKIIEFYGDFWHCNPQKYQADYFNFKLSMTARQKWESDKLRIDFFKKLGYDILIIWELDYNKQKQHILDCCIKFMNGE